MEERGYNVCGYQFGLTPKSHSLVWFNHIHLYFPFILFIINNLSLSLSLKIRENEVKRSVIEFWNLVSSGLWSSCFLSDLLFAYISQLYKLFVILTMETTTGEITIVCNHWFVDWFLFLGLLTCFNLITSIACFLFVAYSFDDDLRNSIFWTRGGYKILELINDFAIENIYPLKILVSCVIQFGSTISIS